MKMTNLKKVLSFMLSVVLIAAVALTFSACNDKNPSSPDSSAPAQTETSVLGNGQTEFAFNVTFKDGSNKSYTIKTDKETVGQALIELELISGQDSQYGLMVETVCGQTVTYDTDGKYWAFYVNGEYAMSGVDTTNVEAGATYAFKVE